jgi:serine/threonine-protein kinase
VLPPSRVDVANGTFRDDTCSVSVGRNAERLVGSELAGYRIEALIGRGGMGAVYRARESGLERMVALKVIAPELAEDERFRNRFLRESKIAASLDHPHVVPIHRAGEESGLLFIAMRYVEGTDLAKLVAQEGALDPRRAVAIVEQVAEALDAAHEQGLVHRDVKPSNVLAARSAARRREKPHPHPARLSRTPGGRECRRPESRCCWRPRRGCVGTR